MNRNNVNIRTIRMLHSLCPSYFPISILKSFFTKLTPYFNLYLSAEIVNEIAGERKKESIILLVLITVLGNFVIALLGGLLSRIHGNCEVLLNQREVAAFNRVTLFMDYSNLENTKVRQLRRKISESAQIDYHGKERLLISLNQMTNNIIDFILSFILCAEMFILVFTDSFGWDSVMFAVLMLGLVSVNVLYIFRIKDKAVSISASLSQAMIDENRIDDAVDCYNMGKDIRLYRQDSIIMNIQKSAFAIVRKGFEKLGNIQFKSNIPLLFTSALMNIIVYIFICRYALSGILEIGSIIKYVSITQTFINCIIGIFNIAADIKSNTCFIDDYISYFDIPRKMNEGSCKIEKHSDKWKCPQKYEIEFCDVSFKYPESGSYALLHVNLKIKSGERLAIVGQNGSGKTTFIKLLCRLYDPDEGVVKLNGVDIKEYDYNDYMSILSVVFQDFKLFSFSLGQNVAAKSEYDSSLAKVCLDKAGFDNRLASMPKGLETCLYKDFEADGVEISGGEAQKIAIARALYKDAPFVILDEPTAALDPIAEADIYSKFDEIVKGRTAIYISHRMSSCCFCDRIAVFDSGQVVQQGSHNYLLADANGKYYELWNAQAQYYKE